MHGFKSVFECKLNFCLKNLAVHGMNAVEMYSARFYAQSIKILSTDINGKDMTVTTLPIIVLFTDTIIIQFSYVECSKRWFLRRSR